MNDKNYHSDCGFADDLVAYLYGEIGAREKSLFEKHLNACSNCSDELAGFTAARFAVKDWRDAEFSGLETPAFVIPYEPKTPRETVSGKSVSLISGWRRFFSLSPPWATSAAALLIVAALIFAATNLYQPDSNGDQVNNSGFPDSQTLVGKTAEQEPKQEPETLLSETQAPKYSEQSGINPENKDVSEKSRGAMTDRKPENRKASVGAVSAPSPKIKNVKQNIETAVATSAKNASQAARRTAPAANRRAPTLNGFEDDDDNTLRLAELFEQIEASR